MLLQCFSTVSGVSKETMVASTISEVQLKVNPPFRLNEVRALFGIETNRVQSVLIQELKHWSNMVVHNKLSLRTPARLLVKFPCPTSSGSSVHSIYLGCLPDMCARLTRVTEKSLFDWLIHFQHSYEQDELCYKNGKPEVMSLAGLHFPEAYRTALQTVCRSKGWPLSKATMMMNVIM